MLWIISVLSAVLLGFSGAHFALHHARRRRVFAQPSERGLHAVPTPTGGGIGIVIALLAAVLLTWLFDWIDTDFALAFSGGLGLVAAAGWWDDHRALWPLVRFAIHTAAAAWFVIVAGGSPYMQLGYTDIALGPLGFVLPFIGMLWLINLFNFMDGIDGLAAGEGIFAGALIGAWFWFAGIPGAALIAFVLAAGCLGFLPLNWPPARLFVGDVGATSLGFTFAALVIYGEQTQTLSALAGMVILGVFVFDATFTLIARWLEERQWYTAHREHAYQHMVRAGLSHGQVSLRLMAINVLLVLPAAVLMHRQPETQGAIALLAIAVGWLLWRRTRSLSTTTREFSKQNNMDLE